MTLFRRLAAKPTGFIPLAWLFLLAFVAVFASWVAPYDPNAADFAAVLKGPSWDHLLGTDQLGRDVLSRLIFASRVALQAGLQAVTTGIVIGVPVGLFVGYLGGWWDRIVMRFVDAVFSLPGLVVAFSVVAILGPGLTNAMFAIGFLFSMRFIRLTRGLTLSVREEVFVEAARLSGASTPRILARYIIPNMLGPLIVQASISFAAVLLIEATLSFLGLAVELPDATWGAMLNDARTVQANQPFLPFPPGLAITFTVLAFNTLGDRLRDVLAEDPSPAPSGSEAAVSPPPDRAEAASDAPGRSDAQALLRVTDLTIEVPTSSGPAPAVNKVSFEILPGEVVGLVGESGSGKSLTALAVAGLLPRGVNCTADSSVHYDGQELLGMDKLSLRRIRGGSLSMVFQEPMSSLNPALTVGYQLAEPLRVHHGLSKKAARARVIELLDRVGVPEPAKRLKDFPHQFSGGMAQRVMIAMALSAEPSLIIADEPTTALDVTTQEQVLELLIGACEEMSMSMLFITHDMGVVAEICDRAVVLYAGEVVESGEVHHVFADPRHPYTSALLQSVPTMIDNAEDRLVTIPGQVPGPGEVVPGCRFASRCAVAVDRCHEARPPLVDVDGDRHLSRCLLTDRTGAQRS